MNRTINPIEYAELLKAVATRREAKAQARVAYYEAVGAAERARSNAAVEAREEGDSEAYMLFVYPGREATRLDLDIQRAGGELGAASEALLQAETALMSASTRLGEVTRSARTKARTAAIEADGAEATYHFESRWAYDEFIAALSKGVYEHRVAATEAAVAAAEAEEIERVCLALGTANATEIDALLHLWVVSSSLRDQARAARAELRRVVAEIGSNARRTSKRAT
jgi:hypothetical protein